MYRAYTVASLDNRFVVAKAVAMTTAAEALLVVAVSRFIRRAYTTSATMNSSSVSIGLYTVCQCRVFLFFSNHVLHALPPPPSTAKHR